MPEQVLRRAELRIVNGTVALYLVLAGTFLSIHEWITLVVVAEAVATLNGVHQVPSENLFGNPKAGEFAEGSSAGTG